MKPALLLVIIGLCTWSSAGYSQQTLDQIASAPHREASAVRDPYRHPIETLRFFDLQPDMAVVEIWPGASGWYTELLAPYLRAQGKLYAAHFEADSSVGFFRSSREAYKQKLAATPGLYDRVILTSFKPPEQTDIAPPGTIDPVLTFRNIHNWYQRGGGDERVLAAFRAFHLALKPGGILGIVEHRLPATTPLSAQESSGYMREDYVIGLARQAGFRLLEKSEINANPADNADHPQGVWTLPPTLRLGEQQRDHYLAIGESDRMTLKFIKETDEQPTPAG